MSFEPPTNDLIRQAFPQIESFELIDKGGFKAVYRIVIQGKIEAFRLLLIPSYVLCGPTPEEIKLVEDGSK